MREKVYCIVKKAGNYYIPVKAECNPYNGQNAYLACLPNFFGGNIQDGECHCMGLAREVIEESHGKVHIQVENLNDRKFQLLYQFIDRGVSFCFYLVTMTEESEYFDGNVLVLDNEAEGLEENQKEMSCILKLPVNRVAGVSTDVFLDICKEWVSPYEHEPEKTLVNIDQGNAAFRDWNRYKGTRDAFRVLLTLR